MTGPERAARERALREIGDELATLVLDDLLPLAHRLQAERARRLGLTMSELACLETVRHVGPLTSNLLCTRTGLGRSAVSKAARRLEAAGHVDRSPSPSHDQAVVIRVVPHQERDDQLERLRSRFRTALAGAAGTAGLDRPRAIAGVATVLRSVTGALHGAASDAAMLRWAQAQRAGKCW